MIFWIIIVDKVGQVKAIEAQEVTKHISYSFFGLPQDLMQWQRIIEIWLQRAFHEHREGERGELKEVRS